MVTDTGTDDNFVNGAYICFYSYLDAQLAYMTKSH